MRIMLVLLMLAGGGGCSATSMRHARHATLGVAVASLACDWGQTRSAASAGWAGTHEANPIMGPSPSTRSVDLYFAATTALVVAIGSAIPEKVRPFLYGSVAAVQGFTIAGNLKTTRGVCGV